MALWRVRAGSMGEYEREMLEESKIAIGYGELPDLAQVMTKDEVRDIYTRANNESDARRIGKNTDQIFSFRHEIRTGELIVLPLKTLPMAVIGMVMGDYEYNTSSDFKHQREVDWGAAMPKSIFSRDMISVLDAPGTVSVISPDNAASILRTILTGQAGWLGTTAARM
ncbi:MAG: hypothetical protein MPJ08_07130 [Nitrosopumilus sp.]|nr:hypothetical protein [Nitrosopumilus sp.]